MGGYLAEEGCMAVMHAMTKRQALLSGAAFVGVTAMHSGARAAGGRNDVKLSAARPVRSAVEQPDYRQGLLRERGERSGKSRARLGLV
jgi:hypothetical protein